MWMLMSMLMMPDYATCRLCERLKGQARRHREAGLSLGFGYATWRRSPSCSLGSVTVSVPELGPGQINKNRLPLNTQVAREV